MHTNLIARGVSPINNNYNTHLSLWTDLHFCGLAACRHIFPLWPSIVAPTSCGFVFVARASLLQLLRCLAVTAVGTPGSASRSSRVSSNPSDSPVVGPSFVATPTDSRHERVQPKHDVSFRLSLMLQYFITVSARATDPVSNASIWLGVGLRPTGVTSRHVLMLDTTAPISRVKYPRRKAAFSAPSATHAPSRVPATALASDAPCSFPRFWLGPFLCLVLRRSILLAVEVARRPIHW